MEIPYKFKTKVLQLPAITQNLADLTVDRNVYIQRALILYFKLINKCNE
jgi:hypothetical protein